MKMPILDVATTANVFPFVMPAKRHCPWAAIVFLRFGGSPRGPSTVVHPYHACELKIMLSVEVGRYTPQLLH